MSEHLIPFPVPDLAAWRSRLFFLTEPVVLDGALFDSLWDWIDNIYTVRTSAKRRKRTGITIRYGDCRLMMSRESGSRPQNSAAEHRHTSQHCPGQCNVSIKIEERVEDSDPTSRTVTISRYLPKRSGTPITTDATPPEHAHDLALSDLRKINTGIRKIVSKQLLNHVEPAQIVKNLNGNGRPNGNQRLCEAGGEKVDTEFVCNVKKSPEVSKQLDVTDARMFRSTWSEDLSACFDYLGQNGFLCEQISSQVEIPAKKRSEYGGAKVSNTQKDS